MARVRVHEFNMGDVEDPEIYLAEPAHRFLSGTDAGAWLKAQGLQCYYNISPDGRNYGYLVTLHADMDDSQRTEWALRWG